MKQNVGSADRMIRVLIALAIFGLGLYYQSYWGLIGIVPLLTALAGWCPLYSLLGLSTNRDGKKFASQ